MYGVFIELLICTTCCATIMTGSHNYLRPLRFLLPRDKILPL